jgi:hypothetical protein
MNKRKLDTLGDVEESISKYIHVQYDQWILPIDCILNIVSFLELKDMPSLLLTCKEMHKEINSFLLSPLHMQTFMGLRVAIEFEKYEYVKAHKLKPLFSDSDLYEDEIDEFIRSFILPNNIFSTQELYGWLQKKNDFVRKAIITDKLSFRFDLLELLIDDFVKCDKSPMAKIPTQALAVFYEFYPMPLSFFRIVTKLGVAYANSFCSALYRYGTTTAFIDMCYRFDINPNKFVTDWGTALDELIQNDIHTRNRFKVFEFIVKNVDNFRLKPVLLEIHNVDSTLEEEHKLLQILVDYGRLTQHKFVKYGIRYPYLLISFLQFKDWNPTELCSYKNDVICGILSGSVTTGEFTLTDIMFSLETHPNWNPTLEILLKHIMLSKKVGNSEYLEWTENSFRFNEMYKRALDNLSMQTDPIVIYDYEDDSFIIIDDDDDNDSSIIIDDDEDTN